MHSSGGDGAAIVSLILMFGVLIILFLITRFFWNWYFKINERTEQNQKIISEFQILCPNSISRAEELQKMRDQFVLLFQSLLVPLVKFA